MRKIRLPLFLGMQLVAGLGSFLLWSAFSHEAGHTTYADAQESLSWGMAAYLPLSLGLPFLLANFSRADVQLNSLRFSLALRVSLAAGAGAILASLGLSTIQALGTVSMSLSIAGLALISVTMQQLARLRWSVGWLALGVAMNIAIPGSWLLSYVLPLEVEWRTSFIVLALGLLAVCQLLVIWTQLPKPRSGEQMTASLLKSVIRTSLPLVPHLLSFGVLMQGARFAAVISDSSAETVTQASYLMLFLGVGFTAIAGAHGLLSATLQKAAQLDLQAIIAKIGLGYGFSGASASIAVTVAVISPLITLFDGFSPLSHSELVWISVAPAALAAYYFQSSVVVRLGRTTILALTSLPVTGVYLIFAVALRPAGDVLLVAFALALCVLQMLPLAFNLRASPLRGKQFLVATLLSLLAYVPALVLALLPIAP